MKKSKSLKKKKQTVKKRDNNVRDSEQNVLNLNEVAEASQSLFCPACGQKFVSTKALQNHKDVKLYNSGHQVRFSFGMSFYFLSKRYDLDHPEEKLFSDHYESCL